MLKIDDLLKDKTIPSKIISVTVAAAIVVSTNLTCSHYYFHPKISTNLPMNLVLNLQQLQLLQYLDQYLENHSLGFKLNHRLRRSSPHHHNHHHQYINQ